MSEKQMADLLALVERQLGKSWIDIVDWLRSTNSLEEIDRRLSMGDMAGVVQSVQDAAERYAADIHAGYTRAGQAAARSLDDQTSSIIRFDQTNDRAIAWADQNQLELVRGFTQEQRETTNRVITEGIRAGDNPRDMAREIQQSIGLTPNQVDAVTSYRQALEAGDYSNALGRELRDGRSDRALAAAMRDRTDIDPSRIDSMVDRYRQNFIAYRAETIARTESMRAVHGGADEIFRQAIERGDVKASQLVGQWIPGPKTKNAREDHRAPSLLSQRPKFGEPFLLPDGSQMQYPGDPAGGPENTANCRCTKTVRFAA